MFVVPEEMQVDLQLRREIDKALNKALDIERPIRYLQENLTHLGDDDSIIIDLLPAFQRAQHELE